MISDIQIHTPQVFSSHTEPVFVQVFFQEITLIETFGNAVFRHSCGEWFGHFQAPAGLNVFFKLLAVDPDTHLWIEEITVVLEPNMLKVLLFSAQCLPERVDGLVEVATGGRGVGLRPEDVHQHFLANRRSLVG